MRAAASPHSGRGLRTQSLNRLSLIRFSLNRLSLRRFSLHRRSLKRRSLCFRGIVARHIFYLYFAAFLLRSLRMRDVASDATAHARPRFRGHRVCATLLLSQGCRLIGCRAAIFSPNGLSPNRLSPNRLSPNSVWPHVGWAAPEGLDGASRNLFRIMKALAALPWLNTNAWGDRKGTDDDRSNMISS